MKRLLYFLKKYRYRGRHRKPGLVFLYGGAVVARRGAIWVRWNGKECIPI